jgi:hypothetical protein
MGRSGGEGFEDVLAEMDAVVESCIRRGSRAGYFAALYRAVTRTVQARAAAGEFEDPEQMRAFVGAFARRYLDAFDAWSGGRATTEAWAAAFAAAQRWRPMVLQHVMLGINAHINLDLAVVTAEAADARGGLAPIAHDFDQVNELLASLVAAGQAAVGSVSPWVGLLDRVGGRADTELVRFSLVQARAAAWRAAQRLVPLDVGGRSAAVAVLDRRVAGLARLVTNGPFTVDLAVLVVRLRERHPVEEVIARLSEIGAVSPGPPR